MSIPIDQPIKLTFTTFSDAAQTTPADPTTVSIDVLDPQNVTTTFTWAGGQVVRDSIGVFHLVYTPAVSGHYAFHWKATGAVATAQDGDFDVEPEYGSLTVTVTDLKNCLDDQNINVTRAQMILNFATVLCESIVNPLPAGAEVVVLDVAQRAYAVPPEGVGPYATIAPATMGAGGLFLTRNNETTLRRLAGRGGAFSIDTIPATFTPSLPVWDTGVTVIGDWDTPPL